MSKKFIEFKISKVKILGFSFTHKENIEQVTLSDERLDSFEYDSSISTKADIEDNRLDFKVDVKVFLPINSSKVNILKIEVLSSFLIKDLINYQVELGKVDIPDEIVKHLIEISISNTRGVLAVKVNETGFENILLPLINVDDLEI